MDMQDNEFDKLFHSKLNNFEAEPSSRVWDAVSDELTIGKRKKVLVSLLSVAASIIVLITVGMLYFPQKASVEDKPPVGKSNVVKEIEILRTNSIIENNNDQQKPEHNNVLTHQQRKMAVAVNTRGMPPQLAANTNPSEPEQPNKIGERGETLISMSAKENVADLVIPGGGSVSIKQPIEEKLPITSNTTLPANQLAAVKKPDATPIKPKYKIHRLGDFINFVVAKVDKRPDKIIEFASTDDDDDETRISGVNLGIIKIKNER
jgi:hypothetical protein